VSWIVDVYMVKRRCYISLASVACDSLKVVKFMLGIEMELIIKSTK
jgi:hypothetical protein